MELDKFADDLRFAEHFSDSQNQISCRDAFTKLAAHVNADHIGSKKVNGLTKHRSLGFNSANSPTDHAQTVDHRRVRISSHQTIGVINSELLPDAFRQVLKIHLMTDADAGRNYAEPIEGLHSPLQELVARVIAL